MAKKVFEEKWDEDSDDFGNDGNDGEEEIPEDEWI